MNLNKLRDEAYSIAKANGWHNEEHSDSHCLMLVITEIAEAVNADRNNSHADIASFKEIMSDIPFGATLAEHNDWFKKAFENHIKNTVEDELSDVVIRCLDLCGLRKLNAGTVKVEFPTGMDAFTERMFFICRLLTDRILANDNAALEFVLSQAMSYIMEHCYRKDIDLEFFIETKMKYNRLRGYRHGGKKY